MQHLLAQTPTMPKTVHNVHEVAAHYIYNSAMGWHPGRSDAESSASGAQCAAARLRARAAPRGCGCRREKDAGGAGGACNHFVQCRPGAHCHGQLAPDLIHTRRAQISCNTAAGVLHGKAATRRHALHAWPPVPCHPCSFQLAHPAIMHKGNALLRSSIRLAEDSPFFKPQPQATRAGPALLASDPAGTKR